MLSACFKFQLPLAKTMGQHRPKAIDDPSRCMRTGYLCTTWRWRTRMLSLMAAALVVVMPTADAATHARGHLGRPWPTAAAGAGAGFAASPFSPAVRCSFRRQSRHHDGLSAVAGRSTYGSSSSSGGPHRHSSTGWSTGPVSFWGKLHDEHSRNHHHSDHTHRCRQRQHGWQMAAHLLPVGARGGAPPHFAHAVGVGMNVSASAEVLQSVEGKESTVTITEAGGRPHTATSRARISAANKGKEPWNKGGRHSEETRRKIAEGARNAARKRKEATALSLVRGGHGVWA